MTGAGAGSFDLLLVRAQIAPAPSPSKAATMRPPMIHALSDDVFGGP